MTIAWVLGSSGLLGAALCRALRRRGSKLFFPVQRFSWDSAPELSSQITAAVQSFSAQVRVADRWEIYWAAGVGTMGSTEEALAPETRALTLIIKLLEAEPRLMAAPGAIAFASSAGAIYAGSSDDIITENTDAEPTTAYAREKLRQEELVRSFALANDGTTALIARISTLYGLGQATGKQQGLLSHIARSILRNKPVQIYVPYDTIRDYISADDAAASMVTTLRTTNERPHVLLKIIASEHPVTIAEIVSIFKRIARRTPRIVTSASKHSTLYSRRVQFRSIAFLECAKTPTKRLPVGIAQLMSAERAAFVRGRAS
ncbi:NAD-dependent epimerase/dehydratase family protein [Propionivibrio sp.]|uniref:NAD-dependent epimerase/dehydratase family protein n=1 Tax=Propionivibrio sp. TaxID=2212460 RepID=UPI003BF2CEC1